MPPNHHPHLEITTQQTECIPSPPLLVKLQVLLGLCFFHLFAFVHCVPHSSNPALRHLGHCSRVLC